MSRPDPCFICFPGTTFRITCWSALSLGLLLFLSACSDSPKVEHDSNHLAVHVELDPASPEYGIVYIRGISASNISQEDLATTFTLYQQDTWLEDPTIPPMLGDYSKGPDYIRFEPRFPLVAGLSYRVQFNPTLQLPRQDTLITVPRFDDGQRATVTQIFPTTDVLPDNLLKLYIHFSAPMSQGMAYEQITLYNQTTGERVEGPFVEMEPELWDPAQERFTLLFDPGRIKRDVGTNIEVGPPLQVGHTYTLRVSAQWSDVHGNPLREGYTKIFTVAASDRVKPSVDALKVTAPSSDSSPLVVAFPEPMDHGLLHRFVEVIDMHGHTVPGGIEIMDQEQQWGFTPDSPWEAGRYEVRIDARLEDVAGNTFHSVFDVDLQEAEASEVREAEPYRSVFVEVGR